MKVERQLTEHIALELLFAQLACDQKFSYAFFLHVCVGSLRVCIYNSVSLGRWPGFTFNPSIFF
jgi:hypothetical protein